MAFSELTLTFAWLRANGHCECHDPGHTHPGGRCNRPLRWTQKDAEQGEGAWQARHKNENGGHISDYLHNCEVRCGGCAASEAEAPGQPIPRSDTGRPGQGRPAGTPVGEEKA